MRANAVARKFWVDLGIREHPLWLKGSRIADLKEVEIRLDQDLDWCTLLAMLSYE